MSDIDDSFDGEDGAPASDPASENEAAPAVAAQEGEAAVLSAHGCLACGAVVSGVFCAVCGQKNDDMRRSVFLLARDFIEDTFSFDSRMWRTLGLLAISPGTVPRDYAHGRRSRFTPPVRLFIVISFLFFVTIAMTDTLFLGVEVRKQSPEEIEAGLLEAAKYVSAEELAELREKSEKSECQLKPEIRFFVPDRDLATDMAVVNRCVGKVTDAARRSLKEDAPAEIDGESIDLTLDFDDSISSTEAIAGFERVMNGVTWVIENPRQFNDAINTWLPRVMFLMTPVLALFLSLFIRGRDALMFDNMVTALYVHAVSFVIIGAALLLARLGLAGMELAAIVGVAGYYSLALKRAYGRGWRKTIWTALGTGFLYQIVLSGIILAIVIRTIWMAPT